MSMQTFTPSALQESVLEASLNPITVMEPSLLETNGVSKLTGSRAMGTVQAKPHCTIFLDLETMAAPPGDVLLVITTMGEQVSI